MTFKRPCLDCGQLTDLGDRCRLHKTQAEARWKAGRPNPYADPAWKRLSAEVRRKRNWCQSCGTTRDLTVDHLDPISEGNPLLAPEWRLVVLCRPCHGRKTKHTKGGPNEDRVV